MQAHPQKLDDFAAFFGKYMETTANKEQLEKSHSTVICMYNMLVVSAQDHIVEVWGFGQG